MEKRALNYFRVFDVNQKFKKKRGRVGKERERKKCLINKLFCNGPWPLKANI